MKKNSILILSFIALCGVGAAVYFGTKSENSKAENGLNAGGKQGEAGQYRVTKIYDVGDISTLIIADSKGTEFTFSHNNQTVVTFIYSTDKGMAIKKNEATKQFDVYNAKQELLGSTQALTSEEIVRLAKT
jgi:hypothetical protein